MTINKLRPSHRKRSDRGYIMDAYERHRNKRNKAVILYSSDGDELRNIFPGTSSKFKFLTSIHQRTQLQFGYIRACTTFSIIRINGTHRPLKFVIYTCLICDPVNHSYAYHKPARDFRVIWLTFQPADGTFILSWKTFGSAGADKNSAQETE